MTTKAEATRRLVVDHTKQEMTRQGISRLTMDVIAQGLGMSKRTLYQLFPGKVCLVKICLADIAAEWRRLLLSREVAGQSCVHTLFGIVGGYVDLMHYLGRTLLIDLAEEGDYRSFGKREEAFWLQQFVDALNRCRACGYLLLDIDPDRFANDLLVLLYENSLRSAPFTTQRLFCQALLRGIFKTDIIPLIDEYVEEHEFAPV